MPRIDPNYSFHLLSDTALEIRLGEQIDPAVLDQVLQLTQHFKRHPPEGLSDIIPSYTRVTLRFDPYRIGPGGLTDLASLLSNSLPSLETYPPSAYPTIHVPVCYEGIGATDLQLLSEKLQLSVREIIDLHTAQPFRVYMLGFLPGFPYLGILPDSLHVPRKSKPEMVAAGTVAIAAAQTGIYPADSPGGWWRIGRTPLQLFQPTDERTTLFEPGDQVQFHSVDQVAFAEIQSQATQYSLEALREKGGWI